MENERFAGILPPGVWVVVVAAVLTTSETLPPHDETIGALALILMYSIGTHVPEVVTGLVGVVLILAALISSIIRRRNHPDEDTENASSSTDGSTTPEGKSDDGQHEQGDAEQVDPDGVARQKG